MIKLGSNKKILIAILSVLGLAVAGYIIYINREPNGADRYRTQAAEIGVLTQTVSANGTLNPVKLVNVGTQVSGTVKKLYVDFNDKVKAGQVLMELDPSIYLSQNHQSQANSKNFQSALKLAQAEEERMRSLYEQDFISKQDLDKAIQAREAAQAQAIVSQAQVEKDRINLSYTIIRSPVSGVVIGREVDIGQTVAASFQTPTLFKIAQDLSKMQIDSSVAEADVGMIRVDQPVRFNVDAFPSRQFMGRVKQVRLNPTTLQNVVTYNVVIDVDNSDQTLLPGMTAYINIITNRRKDVLLIPNSALRFRPSEEESGQSGRRESAKKRESGEVTVFVLEENKPKPIRIRIGITDNKFTEVLEGELKSGDLVVVADMRAQSGKPAGGATPRIRMF